MGKLKVYGRGMIRKLDETGDSSLDWDPENEKEVKAAEEMFKANMKIEGMKAYEVGKDGKKVDKELKRFNPNSAHIILVPRIAGGAGGR